MQKMFYVYIISSKIRNYIYGGLSNNIKKRILQHQQGQNRTTKSYKPFDLIRVEEFMTRSEARQREKYLKSGVGKEWVRFNLL